LLLPLVFLGADAIFSIHKVTNEFNKANHEMGEISGILTLKTTITEAAMPLHDYLIRGDPRERGVFERAARKVDQTVKATLAEPLRPPERSLITSAQKRWRRIEAESRSLLNIRDPIGNPVAGQKMERLDIEIHQTVAMTARASRFSRREIHELKVASNEAGRKALARIMLVFALALGATIITGAMLARSILRPLNSLTESAARFAAGELSHRVPRLSIEELAQFGRAFNFMGEMLEEDKAELESNQARLKQSAVTDGLTGLHNHAEFQNQLKAEIERWRRHRGPVSLLMLDIDDFKRVNDTRGHPAGDKVLAALAAQIQAAIRPIDIAARYGGEEFAVILPQTDMTGAFTTAKRLREEIESMTVSVNHDDKVTITVSIGVASLPDGARTASELIGKADAALYAAKAAGRNRVA